MSLSVEVIGSGVRARADGEELTLLASLPEVLASIDLHDEDPASERLHPRAYDDASAEREFRRLADTEIVRARDADRDTLADLADRLAEGPADIAFEQAEACLRAIGTARIVIAARHGMFDEEELAFPPETPQHTIVAFLGYLQEALVDAVSTRLTEG